MKDDDDDSENRAQWGNGLEFLMSCIAMSVGLGNIWRFPFTAKENGGGAFLIPYLIVLTVIGRPLYYMEMALGQFSSRGNVKMYEKLSPVLKSTSFDPMLPDLLHFLFRYRIWTVDRINMRSHLLLLSYGHYFVLFDPFFYRRFAMDQLQSRLG